MGCEVGEAAEVGGSSTRMVGMGWKAHRRIGDAGRVAGPSA